MLDCSESQLNGDNLRKILDEHKGKVRVLKAYKNPVGDAGAQATAAWLHRVDELPVEIHLSHCDITASGFEALLGAVRARQKPGCPPLWLKVNANRIDPACIQRAGAGVCLAENPKCRPNAACAAGSAACLHLKRGLKQQAEEKGQWGERRRRRLVARPWLVRRLPLLSGSQPDGR